MELSGEPYRNYIHSIKTAPSKVLYSFALRDFMKYRNVARCDMLLEGDTRPIYIVTIEQTGQHGGPACESLLLPQIQRNIDSAKDKVY